MYSPICSLPSPLELLLVYVFNFPNIIVLNICTVLPRKLKFPPIFRKTAKPKPSGHDDRPELSGGNSDEDMTLEGSTVKPIQMKVCTYVCTYA